MTRARTRCPVRPFDLPPAAVVDEAKRIFDPLRAEPGTIVALAASRPAEPRTEAACGH